MSEWVFVPIFKLSRRLCVCVCMCEVTTVRGKENEIINSLTSTFNTLIKSIIQDFFKIFLAAFSNFDPRPRTSIIL